MVQCLATYTATPCKHKILEFNLGNLPEKPMVTTPFACPFDIILHNVYIVVPSKNLEAYMFIKDFPFVLLFSFLYLQNLGSHSTPPGTPPGYGPTLPSISNKSNRKLVRDEYQCNLQCIVTNFDLNLKGKPDHKDRSFSFSHLL